MNETVPYGTRWSRTTVVALAAFGAIAALLTMMNREIVATSIVYQGSTAQFSTTRVAGEDVGFGMSRMTRTNADGTTTEVNVLSAGFAVGNLNGFCLSQRQSVAGLGQVTIKITAGDGQASTSEIEAANVQFDLVHLRGTGPGVNLDGEVHIGLATQDITTIDGVDNPLGSPLGTGYFGIDATAGDIHQARGRLYNAEIGGPMSLPGLKIVVLPGDHSCDADPFPN